MFISSEFTTSSIVTSADEFCPPSFTPFEMAICECSSIIPAVKCFPVASITFPFWGKFFPILMIFPFSIKTSVSFKTPSFSPVQTVAFLNNIVSCFGFVLFPKAIFGKVIG